MLPAIGEPKTGGRDDFEVAGEGGRLVLDAVLTQAPAFLKPGGRILTIATSLQGQRETEALLNEHFPTWSYVEHLELALTDECGPPYIAWWLAQTEADGQRRVFQHDGDATWWHDVWVLSAEVP